MPRHKCIRVSNVIVSQRGDSSLDDEDLHSLQQFFQRITQVGQLVFEYLTFDSRFHHSNNGTILVHTHMYLLYVYCSARVTCTLAHSQIEKVFHKSFTTYIHLYVPCTCTSMYICGISQTIRVVGAAECNRSPLAM